MEYDFPKPGTIPVPQLEKPREKREARPQSVLSNFEVPNYEEISMYSGKPSIMTRSFQLHLSKIKKYKCMGELDQKFLPQTKQPSKITHQK